MKPYFALGSWGNAYCVTEDPTNPDALFVEELLEVEDEGEYFFEGKHWEGVGGGSFVGFTPEELVAYLEGE